LPRSDVESFGLAFLIAFAAATFIVWLRFFVPNEEREQEAGRFRGVAEKPRHAEGRPRGRY
jgi:hypothetical protein